MMFTKIARTQTWSVSMLGSTSFTQEERKRFFMKGITCKKNQHFICKDENTLEEDVNLEEEIVGTNDQLETAEERNNDINLDEEVLEPSGERVAAASRKKKKK